MKYYNYMSFRIILYITFLILAPSVAFSQNKIPVNDTIHLTMQHIEGRWIEETGLGRDNIYIFKEDSSFFKAVDNKDLLLFNVSGKFRIHNDSLKIAYQDMSGRNISGTKIRTMYFRIIALSDDELNIYKTERNRTSFMRLKRQNIK